MAARETGGTERGSHPEVIVKGLISPPTYDAEIACTVRLHQLPLMIDR